MSRDNTRNVRWSSSYRKAVKLIEDYTKKRRVEINTNLDLFVCVCEPECLARSLHLDSANLVNTMQNSPFCLVFVSSRW